MFARTRSAPPGKARESGIKQRLDGARPGAIFCGIPGWIVLLAVLTAPACSAPGEPEPEVFAGPIPHRSMMPLSLIFPGPLPDDARVLERAENRLSWNTSYASILVKEQKAGELISVDGEFLRTSLLWERGVGSRVQVGLEIPFLYYMSGFLDAFVENFHDFFGFPQGDRDKYPRNHFDATYQQNNRTFFESSEDKFGLADIPLYCKVGLVDPEEGGFGLAARGLLELPAGSEDKGFGSGKLDGGAGLLAQAAFTPSLAAYLNVDHTWRSDPDAFRGVEAANVTHGSLALEKALSPVFSLVAQTDYQTRPLTGADLHEFKRPKWNASLGFGWRTGRDTMLKFYFTEGITTHTTADFAVGLSLGTRF
ncbi:MAG: DUF3187 family protein [Armatimonadia bacterium]|nr:DUF3187 family protein [Armatimonadia bacterium]